VLCSADDLQTKYKYLLFPFAKLQLAVLKVAPVFVCQKGTVIDGGIVTVG
jgi:hypothetical protein